MWVHLGTRWRLSVAMIHFVQRGLGVEYGPW